MKALGIGLLLFTTFLESGIAQASTDDLIIQSKVDAKTLSWLVDKTQIILANTHIAKGIASTVTLTHEPKFTMDEISDGASLKKFQTLVSTVFHVDTSKAILRLRIPTIYYNVDQITAGSKLLEVHDPYLQMTAHAEINGVDIGLNSGLQVDFMIPDPKTKEYISYLTASLDPVTISVPKNLPPAGFDVTFQTIRDKKIQFDLLGYNLDSIPNYVKSHQGDFVIKMNQSHGALSPDNIHVNPVTVRLGSLSRSFSFDEFKPVVQAEMNDFVSAVIVRIADSLKTSIGPRVLDSVFAQSTRSDFEFSNDNIYVKYDAALFTQPSPDQIAFNIAGTTCTHASFLTYQAKCEAEATPADPARIVSDADHQAAKAELTQKISQSDTAAAVSISEEYINRLLKTAMDAKLWDDMLSDDNLELGEKGMFVVFDEQTQAPDLFLDLYYNGDGSRFQNVFINPNKPLHFPLRLGTAMQFENRNSVPYLVIKTTAVKSDADEIIHGIAEFGLSSHLVWGLKGKIAKMILKMADSMVGKTALEMDLPMFRNLGLEKDTFEVSAHGRLNLYFKP